MSHKRIRDLASRAIRLSAEDGKITGFGLAGFDQHEKSIVDNLDFLCRLVKLAEMDERETCAKVCDVIAGGDWVHPETAEECATAIRARGQE